MATKIRIVVHGRVDRGQSFSKAIDVDAASGAASQSFFTMNVSPKGVVYAAWLDGRDRNKGRQGTAAVYAAKSANRGASFEPSVRVALDARPCCRPSIGFTGSDTVQVAWRKLLEDNVRDIFVSASNDGGATWSGHTVFTLGIISPVKRRSPKPSWRSEPLERIVAL